MLVAPTWHARPRRLRRHCMRQISDGFSSEPRLGDDLESGHDDDYDVLAEALWSAAASRPLRCPHARHGCGRSHLATMGIGCQPLGVLTAPTSKYCMISLPGCIAYRPHRTQYRVAFTPNPEARIKG